MTTALRRNSSKKRTSETGKYFTEFYVWGNDLYGQLGLGHKYLQTGDGEGNTPKVLQHPKSCSFSILIESVACGEDFTFLVTKRGLMYAMGSNQFGKLGISSDSKVNETMSYASTPKLVDCLANKVIRKVSCGLNHAIAVTSSDTVYSWGCGSHGQLGRDSNPQFNSPQSVSTFKEKGIRIQDVAAGGKHSLFLTKDSHVWASGMNDFGQLGTGINDTSVKQMLPVPVYHIKEAAAQIACGLVHSQVLTKKGRVISFGDNQFGQLGLGKDSVQSSSIPIEIPSIDNIKQISCNHHSAAIGERGELYFWGTGVFGTFHEPKVVVDADVVDVQVGGCFGIAQDKEGMLWSWGQNSSGELGLNDFKTRLYPHPILALKRKTVKKFACGGAFTIVLGKDKKVMSPTVSARASVSEQNKISEPISQQLSQRESQKQLMQPAHVASDPDVNPLILHQNAFFEGQTHTDHLTSGSLKKIGSIHSVNLLNKQSHRENSADQISIGMPPHILPSFDEAPVTNIAIGSPDAQFRPKPPVQQQNNLQHNLDSVGMIQPAPQNLPGSVDAQIPCFGEMTLGAPAQKSQRVSKRSTSAAKRVKSKKRVASKESTGKAVSKSTTQKRGSVNISLRNINTAALAKQMPQPKAVPKKRQKSGDHNLNFTATHTIKIKGLSNRSRTRMDASKSMVVDDQRRTKSKSGVGLDSMQPTPTKPISNTLNVSPITYTPLYEETDTKDLTINTLKKNMALLQKENNSLHTELGELQQQFQRSKNQNLTQEQMLVQIQNEMQKTQDLEFLLQKKEKEVKQLRHEIDIEMDARKQIEHQNILIKNENQQLLDQRKAMELENKQLKEALSEMGLACSQLKDQRDQFSGRFEHLNKEVSNIKKLASTVQSCQATAAYPLSEQHNFGSFDFPKESPPFIKTQVVKNIADKENIQVVNDIVTIGDIEQLKSVQNTLQVESLNFGTRESGNTFPNRSVSITSKKANLPGTRLSTDSKRSLSKSNKKRKSLSKERRRKSEPRMPEILVSSTKKSIQSQQQQLEEKSNQIPDRYRQVLSQSQEKQDYHDKVIRYHLHMAQMNKSQEQTTDRFIGVQDQDSPVRSSAEPTLTLSVQKKKSLEASPVGKYQQILQSSSLPPNRFSQDLSAVKNMITDRTEKTRDHSSRSIQCAQYTQSTDRSRQVQNVFKKPALVSALRNSQKYNVRDSIDEPNPSRFCDNKQIGRRVLSNEPDIRGEVSKSMPAVSRKRETLGDFRAKLDRLERNKQNLESKMKVFQNKLMSR